MKNLILFLSLIIINNFTTSDSFAKDVIKIRKETPKPEGPVLGGDCTNVCGRGMSGFMVNGVCTCWPD